MGNRRKLRKPQKESKLECPECGGTEFDVLKDYGVLDDNMYDAIACRRCPWSGAVRADKIRSVKE